MRVNEDQILNEKIVVLVNGKWCRGAVEADDKEGWVCVPDPLGIPQLPPEYINKESAKKAAEDEGAQYASTAELEQAEVEYTGWEAIPTKKIYGIVDLRTIEGQKYTGT